MAGGSAIGASSQAVGGAIGMGVDAHVRGQNWSRQKNILQHQIYWRKKDLEDAGLNPVLAASSGLGGQTAPSLGGSNSVAYGSNLGAGMASGAKAALAGSEKARNIAQTAAASATANNQNQQAINRGVETPYIRDKANQQAWDAKSAQSNFEKINLELVPMRAMSEMLMDPKRRKMWQSKQLYNQDAWRTGASIGDSLYDWYQENDLSKIRNWIPGANSPPKEGNRRE